jgi:hypothetical protein
MSPKALRQELDRCARMLPPDCRSAYPSLSVVRQPSTLAYWTRTRNPFTGEPFTAEQLLRMHLFNEAEASL